MYLIQKLGLKYMKTLETKRLILRLFQHEDLDDFYAYAKVEGVGERAGWFHHKSKEESLSVLESFMRKKDVYAIVLKENNKVIGSIGLHAREESDNVLELGYVLSKAYWGQGLMSEAVDKVIEYCFEDLELESLTCGHFLENHASRRIIEKSGFRFVAADKYYSKNMDQEFAHRKYVLNRERYNRIKEDKIVRNMTQEERWKLFPITLKPYTHDWQIWYEEMALKLKRSLKESIERITHIGSTAVKGLVAKPSIDILLEIHQDTHLEAFIEKMQDLGLRYQYQESNPKPHMMFTLGYTSKGYAERIYHIHVRYLGDWDELYFKDYLNEDDGVRKAYEKLKLELAVVFKHDRIRYTDSKTDFIKEATRKARLKYGYIYALEDQR